jgi:hypothetical protein
MDNYFQITIKIILKIKFVYFMAFLKIIKFQEL